MDDIAIRVEHISKSFLLPHERQNSIKGSLISMIRGGKRTYEKQHVLKDVSFEIKKGEFFGIVGRNGSGKSTLLKMLAGIYTPTAGEIQTIGKLTPFIELGVGFNPELTGRENVFLNGALLGFSRKQMLEMYQDIVDFAELEKFMDQKLKNYSSGMQVRLAFSIAIRVQTDILVLDEVLAVGDEAFQRKCFDYFSQLKRLKKTVVLVTHDMNAVREYCDRAILIEQGKIVEKGYPKSVSKAYSALFNLPELEKKEPITRWGNGKAKFEKVAVKQRVHGKGKLILDIDMSIVAHEAILGVVKIAYTIKSIDGRSLFGDGFELILPNSSKGEKRGCKIAIDNILSNGKYSLDLSLYLKDEEDYADAWLDCAEFTIKNSKPNELGIITNSDIKIDI